MGYGIEVGLDLNLHVNFELVSIVGRGFESQLMKEWNWVFWFQMLPGNSLLTRAFTRLSFSEFSLSILLCV